MCVVHALYGLTNFALDKISYKKARKKDETALNATNQVAINMVNQAVKQAEQNKIANSVQTTNPLPITQNMPKKNVTQRLPLNISQAGVPTGKQPSIGLNLGGY